MDARVVLTGRNPGGPAVTIWEKDGEYSVYVGDVENNARISESHHDNWPQAWITAQSVLNPDNPHPHLVRIK